MLHSAADSTVAGPFAPRQLADELARLGLATGDVVIAHLSIRSVGWIIGGGVGLLAAIRLAIGESGTLVVPTFTTYLNDPSSWVNRPVPREWWPAVRDGLPPFDPALHAAQPGLGRFPELVRRIPDARRSTHPLYSFAAAGRQAGALTGRHELAYGMGIRSPLAPVAETGKVLLIGVGWDRCSLLHLCEHRTPYPGRRRHVVRVPTDACDGVTGWRDTDQLVMFEGDFGAIGEQAERAGIARRGAVGVASCVLCPAADLVALGGKWMAAHRDLRRAILPHYLRDPVPAAETEL
jgi:aminoglycoside 3-N-acetyltransferase